ncbi:MAG: phospholipase D-like domain-containing protein [Rubripirellula sp.]|jgi:phosphatidylserine/phosphatidylglycerophosphate/cardiolipin synthase-like enzyme
MLNPNIKDALQITLDDHRMSRGEKRALAKVIEQHVDSDHELSHARSVLFELARQELSDPHALKILDWVEEASKVLAERPDPDKSSKAEAFFSPVDNCTSKIIRLFQETRRKADVCVFTITDDRIKDAILDAHQRGILVRIISDNDKSNDLGSDIYQLERAGVPVRCDRTDYHMHHKYAIFDGKSLLTGSYNWTRSAARNNEENFIVTADSSLLQRFENSFAELWEQLK